MNITVSEARAILIVCSKLKLDDHEDVARVCTYLSDNNICKSAGAVRFLHELEEVRDTLIAGYTCPICGNQLRQGENIICRDCHEQMLAMLPNHAIPEDNDVAESESPEPEVKREWKIVTNYRKVKMAVNNFNEKVVNAVKKTLKIINEKIHSTRFWIGLGIRVSVVALIILALFLIRRSLDVPGKVERVFKEELSKQGYMLGNGYAIAEGCVAYDILPSYESMMIFTEGKNKFVGAALNMKGSDEVSRSRQAILISRLNMAVYDDIDEGDAINLVSLISHNDGYLDFRGYQCLLILDGEKATYYIQDDRRVNNAATDYIRENGVSSLVADKTVVDATDLIGKSYKNCNERFGEGKAIVSANTLYYEKAGLSIVYNEEDETVVYADCDGTGTEANVNIAGMYIGEATDEVKNILDSQGIKYKESKEDSSITAKVCYNGLNMQLIITFKDERVTLVSIELE